VTCFPKHAARIAAASLAEKKWAGPDCASRHGGLRWTATGQCVACNNIRSRDRARIKAAQPEVLAARAVKSERRERERAERVAAQEARRRNVRTPMAQMPAHAAAKAAGEAHWHGPPCSACGQTLRYVRKGKQCVTCARAIVARLRPRKKDDPAWHEALARQKAESAERRKKRDRERQKTPEFRAWEREWRRDYMQDPERREKKRQRDRGRQMSPAQKRAYRQARRAREANAPGSFTASDIERLDQQQGGKCAYCDKGWDHVGPANLEGKSHDRRA
jgi:hypothetical protein